VGRGGGGGGGVDAPSFLANLSSASSSPSRRTILMKWYRCSILFILPYAWRASKQSTASIGGVGPGGGTRVVAFFSHSITNQSEHPFRGGTTFLFWLDAPPAFGGSTSCSAVKKLEWANLLTPVRSFEYQDLRQIYLLAQSILCCTWSNSVHTNELSATVHPMCLTPLSTPFSSSQWNLHPHITWVGCTLTLVPVLV